MNSLGKYRYQNTNHLEKKNLTFKFIPSQYYRKYEVPIARTGIAI